MKHVVIGTAGHIDHGKTALVKAKSINVGRRGRVCQAEPRRPESETATMRPTGFVNAALNSRQYNEREE